jgi:hypothetical protein
MHGVVTRTYKASHCGQSQTNYNSIGRVVEFDVRTVLVTEVMF